MAQHSALQEGFADGEPSAAQGGQGDPRHDEVPSKEGGVDVIMSGECGDCGKVLSLDEGDLALAAWTTLAVVVGCEPSADLEPVRGMRGEGSPPLWGRIDGLQSTLLGNRRAKLGEGSGSAHGWNPTKS